jgi:CDP-diacylglycerol---glycerol-3-phosphate 3-phosphatidyltransferase
MSKQAAHKESNKPTASPTSPTSPTITDRARALAMPIIDPIVTFLARYRFSPDTLTVLGVLGHILVVWFVVQGQMFVAGAGLLLIAPLDALDGSLARKLGRKQGGIGAFLDSTLDRLAEIILFGGFIYYYTAVRQDTTLTLVAYIAITGSLMVSYIRSRAEGLGYDCKIGLFGRLERYVVLIVLLLLNLPDLLMVILAVGTAVTTAQRLWYVWRQATQTPEN